MSYDANSIKVRDFRTACRATPGMYIGADRQDGIFNCFLEILNNSCDEAMMGRGNKIEVELKDNCDEIKIIDHGIGIPHGPNKDCKEVLIELFTSAHSSGKFDTANYKKVRGCHGIGSSAVCVTSTSFQVTTKRDGYCYSLEFKDGLPTKDIAERGSVTKETGTIISFIPDKTIYHLEQDEKSFDPERIKQELKLTSYFIPKVQFSFIYNGETISFLSKNGLKDFAADNIRKPLHQNYIYGYKHFGDDVEIEVFAQWTNEKEQCYVFSNGALNIDGGTPITGAKTAFTKTINSLSNKDFDSDLIRKGLVYIINIRHPKPFYQNQTKSKIQNTELRGYTQTVFTEAIKQFVLNNKEDFSKIIELLSNQQRADIAAQKARDVILNHIHESTEATKKKIIESNKLRDARKLGENSILLCVEGLSAGGSMSIGRDPNKYGILMLRGKAINALTNPIEDVLENEEAKLLLQALGVTYGKPYDFNKLRYGKVAISADSDFDGSHIGLLIMSLLYKLVPGFLEAGRLCWLRAPLYKVENGKKTTFYYTEEEFQNKKETGDVIKYKGIGQVSKQDLKNSMFNETQQRLENFTFSPDSAALLEELMGKDVQPRKDFVFNNIDFGEFVYG